MKKLDIIDGQINLFDIPIQEPVEPKSDEEKTLYIEKQEIEVDNFKDIINLYKNSCNRIIKTASGALMVEIEDKTLYFNRQGKNEFNLSADVGLIPADEIILANKDKELNEVQLKKLEEIGPERYIKRKGEANVIIPMNSKVMTITYRGWVLEWNMKPVYKEDEVFTFKNDSEEIQEDQELNIGDAVEFLYEKENCKGKITRIYNNGDTVNVTWDGKHTAFYYKCVKKIA